MACPCGEAGGLADSVAPLESREFQAGPLLPPVPTQVPQLAARAASLLEHHAIQLCQHTGRDRAGDEAWGHRTSRLPAQVLLGAWPPLMRPLLPAAPISFPFSPLPLSFPHFVPFFHCFLSVCNYLVPCLKERWSQRVSLHTSQHGPLELRCPALRHEW